jgi:hypothetical protein
MATPATELRHLPADNPPPPPGPPLAKLSPPLGSPDPPRAKATTHCPRTGSPAANHRRAHRRPGFSPADGRFDPPSICGAVSPPPSALAGVWARGDDVIPSRARAVTRLGPQLGRRPRARARYAWLARNPPGPPVLESLFFFLFPTFSPLISIFSIFYAPKIIKMISRSHVIIMLEMTHYN